MMNLKLKKLSENFWFRFGVVIAVGVICYYIFSPYEQCVRSYQELVSPNPTSVQLAEIKVICSGNN